MTTPPAWLEDIHLITFDCFGTLLDWRASLEKVEIRTREDFDLFERETQRLQSADQHQRYAEVLKSAISKVRPQLRPAVIGLFADDFGRTPAFADSARALATLRDVVKVGVLANSDASHQLDALATLSVAWDLCITSQELRAYKPSDRAWDAILRIGVARSAVTRDGWLHVSAFDHLDLIPARARRLHTCLVRRPGADDKVPADLTVESLDELANLVLMAKRGPLQLEVASTCSDSATATRLCSWLRQTYLVELRATPGVRGATLIEREDGTLAEQVLFGGQAEYEQYLATYAAEHRAMVREAFPEGVERVVRVSSVRARV